ncbi:hypothetical protein EDI_114930 [Entamoeba dispar SAW760]|uniref:Uncharacterized protein n=1 Tax=Entamoeba dispar (strain ATCC PRA-260 / SAW760) TaxID=370354 RepID=B0ES72_ENTDS|nr:uncharacterized protein EDI_114930 [Entamoeba dispar SAW760]EDR22620.1 hypothetical protein EDI_114930 [Entamoeba dispar SAW760]|eukprot:EDR22620.1 hypothetical protein EDI_114930 [Entamoeba dispar SAW760]
MDIYKQKIDSLVDSFKQLTRSQIEIVYGFFHNDFDKTSKCLMEIIDDIKTSIPLTNYKITFESDQKQLPVIPEQLKFVKYKKYRFMTIEPIKKNGYNHCIGSVYFTKFEKMSPAVFGNKHQNKTMNEKDEVIENDNVEIQVLGSSSCIDKDETSNTKIDDALSKNGTKEGKSINEKDIIKTINPTLTVDEIHLCQQENTILDHIIEEYINNKTVSTIPTFSPICISPNEDNSIEMEVKNKNENVLIKYTIPRKIKYENIWIGIYDRYETNLHNFIKRIELKDKITGKIQFNEIKRGKYTVRIFVSETNEGSFQPRSSCDVVVGPIVFMTCNIVCYNSKRMLEVRVSEEGEMGWIGIYPHHPTTRNEDYIICTPMRMNYPIEMNITELKKGTYECRYFSKESGDGMFSKSYHCSGSKILNID